MTKRDSLSSVDNRYDGPLLTDSSHASILLRYGLCQTRQDLSPKPHLTALQPSHVLFLQEVHYSAPYRRVLQMIVCNSLLQAKAEGFCQQFFSLSKRVLCFAFLLLVYVYIFLKLLPLVNVGKRFGS